VLSLAEKRRVVEIARGHAPKDCLIVSGVNHESSLEARARRPRWSGPARTGCWCFLPTAGRWRMPMTASSRITGYIRDATTNPIMTRGSICIAEVCCRTESECVRMLTH